MVIFKTRYVTMGLYVYKSVKYDMKRRLVRVLKKLDKMKIAQRLKESFKQVIVAFIAVLIIMSIAMIYVVKDYSKVLDKYAYPQGDIAMAMNYSAEVRSATRGIVGYDSEDYINRIKEKHDEAVKILKIN